MIRLALFGAAGKMGTRITARLRNDPEFAVLYVEANEFGEARLRERGLTPSTRQEAIRQADAVVLAVPDNLIADVAPEVVPGLRSGAMLICLDPAAPLAGVLPPRSDITYFVTHPCHPPVVNDETDPEARLDFFGAIKAKQHIVCALMQGPESDYARGEMICRRMFAPVMRAHRVTVEQMAILEPAMSETTVLTCMFVIKEAMQEAVRRGVPEQAALDFLLGHINVNIGILFGYVNAQFSDGAKLAVERARSQIFQPDWKKVFEPDQVMGQIQAITQARKHG